MHGVEAFIGAFPIASLEAMRQGFLSIGGPHFGSGLTIDTAAEQYGKKP